MNSTIVIIDDDFISQFTTKRFIEKYEISDSVLTFPNGQEALNHFSDEANKPFPNTLLLDLNMPVLDGWGFLAEVSKLEELYSNLNVFIMTSSVSEKDIHLSKQYSCVKDYFVKPVSKENLEKLRDFVK